MISLSLSQYFFLKYFTETEAQTCLKFRNFLLYVFSETERNLVHCEWSRVSQSVTRSHPLSLIRCSVYTVTYSFTSSLLLWLRPEEFQPLDQRRVWTGLVSVWKLWVWVSVWTETETLVNGDADVLFLIGSPQSHDSVTSPALTLHHHCSSFRGLSVTKQPTAEETIYFLFTSHDQWMLMVMWRVSVLTETG